MITSANDVLEVSGGGQSLSRSIGNKINISPERSSFTPYQFNGFRKGRLGTNSNPSGRPPSGSGLTEGRPPVPGTGPSSRPPSGSGGPLALSSGTGRMEKRGSLVRRSATKDDSLTADFTYSTSRRPLLMSRASVDISMLGDPNLKNRPTIPTGAMSQTSTTRRAKSASSYSAAAWKAYGSPSTRGITKPPPPSDPMHENPKNVIDSMRGSTVSVGMLGGGFLMPHPRTAPAARPLSAASASANASKHQSYRPLSGRPRSPPLGEPPEEHYVESPRATAVSARHAIVAEANGCTPASGYEYYGLADGHGIEEPPTMIASNEPASPRIVYEQEVRSLEILAQREQMGETCYFQPSTATDPRTKEIWSEILRKKNMMAGASTKSTSRAKSARAGSARPGDRSERFSSTSIVHMQQMGANFQPFRVSGFGQPVVELERPNPDDPSWTLSRVGPGLLDRMKERMSDSAGPKVIRPYSAPASRFDQSNAAIVTGGGAAAAKRTPSAPPRHPPPLAAITEGEETSRLTTPLPEHEVSVGPAPWLEANLMGTVASVPEDPAAATASVAVTASNVAVAASNVAVAVDAPVKDSAEASAPEDELGVEDDGYVQEDSGDEDEIEAAIKRVANNPTEIPSQPSTAPESTSFPSTEPVQSPKSAHPASEAPELHAVTPGEHPQHSQKACPESEKDGDALAGLMGVAQKPALDPGSIALVDLMTGTPDASAAAATATEAVGSGCQDLQPAPDAHAQEADINTAEQPELESAAWAAQGQSDGQCTGGVAGPVEGVDTTQQAEEMAVDVSPGEKQLQGDVVKLDAYSAVTLGQPCQASVQMAEQVPSYRPDVSVPQAQTMSSVSDLNAEQEMPMDATPITIELQVVADGDVPETDGVLGIEDGDDAEDDDTFDPRFLDTGSLPFRQTMSSAGRPTSARPTSARPTSARPISARPTSVRPTSSGHPGSGNEALLSGDLAAVGGMQVIHEADDYAADMGDDLSMAEKVMEEEVEVV